MAYLQEITANKGNPQQLEELYRAALSKHEAGQFSADMEASFAGEPDNLLYQAWRYRLQTIPEQGRKRDRSGVNWKLAAPLAIANGLIFWALSDPKLTFLRGIPYLVLLAAPLIALFVLLYLYLTTRKVPRRILGLGAGLAGMVALALLLNHWVDMTATRDDYLILISLHLALLAWAAVGAALVGLADDADNRFAFLMRSLEVFIVAGVYLIAGMAFGGITMGMFAALSIRLPDLLMRLIAAGGAGLIPVIAVATIYNPLAEPKDQDFNQGLSRFIGTMMRLLLPLTLGVLVIYIFVIPFYFLEPFKNRDVLIIYNVMLFAIMGLLVGATPIDLEELSPRLGSALRTGILAVAILATLISLYALSAILYRTFTNVVTINRLTMTGWNVINIVLLVMMIVRLLARGSQPWNERIKSVYSRGAVAYVGWAVLVIVLMPFLFH
ncbi:MAG: hypothetical protein ACM3PY_06200 [Omnitrophica WOR_2 bacterium]